MGILQKVDQKQKNSSKRTLIHYINEKIPHRFCLFMYLYDTYSSWISYLIAWIIFSTDYTLLSLSTDAFLTEYLLIIKEFVFLNIYLFKTYLSIFWQFPAIIISIIKTIISNLVRFLAFTYSKRTKLNIFV